MGLGRRLAGLSAMGGLVGAGLAAVRRRRQRESFETWTAPADEPEWTPERMRSAKPMPMPTVDPDERDE